MNWVAGIRKSSSICLHSEFLQRIKDTRRYAKFHKINLLKRQGLLLVFCLGIWVNIWLSESNVIISIHSGSHSHASITLYFYFLHFFRLSSIDVTHSEKQPVDADGRRIMKQAWARMRSKAVPELMRRPTFVRTNDKWALRSLREKREVSITQCTLLQWTAQKTLQYGEVLGACVLVYHKKSRQARE